MFSINALPLSLYGCVICGICILCIQREPQFSCYLYAPGCWLISSGVPFLFQDTLGGGIPVVSQLSTALIPEVSVTLNGPGLMEGPTDRREKIFNHVEHTTSLKVA